MSRRYEQQLATLHPSQCSLWFHGVQELWHGYYGATLDFNPVEEGVPPTVCCPFRPVAKFRAAVRRALCKSSVVVAAQTRHCLASLFGVARRPAQQERVAAPALVLVVVFLAAQVVRIQTALRLYQRCGRTYCCYFSECSVPVYGVAPIWFFVLFLLEDHGDENRMVSFILEIKGSSNAFRVDVHLKLLSLLVGFQFLTVGILGSILASVQ
jgi:hypothetical protein